MSGEAGGIRSQAQLSFGCCSCQSTDIHLQNAVVAFESSRRVYASGLASLDAAAVDTVVVAVAVVAVVVAFVCCDSGCCFFWMAKTGARP